MVRLLDPFPAAFTFQSPPLVRFETNGNGPFAMVSTDPL